MSKNIQQVIAALASGAVFGLGLSISGMLNPAKVQGFLDIFGNWDPSLAFVLGGAVFVAFIGVRMMQHMSHPVCDACFHLPSSNQVDFRLLAGSAVFGFGWGLGGFCPGPAVASLSMAIPQTALFVVFMCIGMLFHDRIWKRG